MKTWEVEVYWGSGSDTDSIATYLVHAPTEEAAEAKAIGHSGHLIGAKANLIRHPGSVDEMDYDGILGDPGIEADEKFLRKFGPDTGN